MQNEIARSLWIDASVYFDVNAHLRRSLRWIEQNPLGYEKRVAEFEDTYRNFSTLLQDPETDPFYYGNVLKFRDRFTPTGTFPLSLYDAVTICRALRQTGRQEDDAFLMTVHETFEEIQGKIESNEWGFPNNIINPNQLASAMLIEGFGVFMEHEYAFAGAGVGRDFVLAFEEVLLMHGEGTDLLHDTIGFMQQEKDDFSPGAAKRIDIYPYI
ncbi:MAG TPA: hypothetical protein VLF68_01375 [Candidatus Saccharimonadales bacterium]|nr:hypothetical protein [Candidatus Saccharimonadales bacterium]